MFVIYLALPILIALFIFKVCFVIWNIWCSGFQNTLKFKPKLHPKFGPMQARFYIHTTTLYPPMRDGYYTKFEFYNDAIIIKKLWKKTIVLKENFKTFLHYSDTLGFNKGKIYGLKLEKNISIYMFFDEKDKERFEFLEYYLKRFS